MMQVFIRAWVVGQKNEPPRDLGFEDVSDDMDMSSDDDVRKFLELPETDQIIEYQGATLIWDTDKNRVQMVVLEEDSEVDVDEIAITYERDRRQEMGLK